jgi:hypothetical protein
MDLYVSNFASAEGAPLQNILFRNNGKGVFEDVTKEAGLVAENYSLGAVFGDLDNYGYLDLYVVNNGEPNILYRNKGNGTFENITNKAGVGNTNMGVIAALGDINNDGYLDIYVANSGMSNEEIGEPDILYLNNGGTNHWLQVQLRGKVSNHSGIGARVAVSTGNLRQTREVEGGTGYGQNSPIVNFGLGSNTLAETMEITWPSGIVQTLSNIKADQRITIEEGNPTPVELQDNGVLAWGKVKHTETDSRNNFLETNNFELMQNYPNPFNPETWIPFRLGQGSPVTISIYDPNGKIVNVLNLGYKMAGEYFTKDKAVYWDGKNFDGEHISGGIYFYQIQVDGFTDVRKMLLIK